MIKVVERDIAYKAVETMSVSCKQLKAFLLLYDKITGEAKKKKRHLCFASSVQSNQVKFYSIPLPDTVKH